MTNENLNGKPRLAGGFAAATRPVSETVTTTDAINLDAGEVSIPSGEFSMPGYRAMPAGEGVFPVVLVVHEIFGVHEHIRDICRRFAKVGYFAIAPDLFARQGNASSISDPRELMQAIVNKVADAQVMADLDATVAYVQETGKGDLERLGLTGFCWGGRIAWLYTAHQEKIKAGAAWYGHVVAGTSASELRPRQPVDVAGELHGAMLGQYGGKDEGIPLASLKQMRDALEQHSKVDWEIVLYQNSGHAFFADYRPSYNERDAKAGWTKMLSWFSKYGVV